MAWIMALKIVLICYWHILCYASAHSAVATYNTLAAANISFKQESTAVLKQKENLWLIIAF